MTNTKFDKDKVKQKLNWINNSIHNSIKLYNSIVPLSKEYNSKTKNIVYLVECLKCQDQYIGETKHTLEHRFNQHIGYVNNNDKRQATGKHINSNARLLSDMTITVIESINTLHEAYRKDVNHIGFKNLTSSTKE